jgi:hypothetical protein
VTTTAENAGFFESAARSTAGISRPLT